MFSFCKSRYQAVLLKQKWNCLNQQCAVYETIGEKCVSSTLNWNYENFNDKCFCAIVQGAFSKRHVVKRELMTRKKTRKMWITCEDRLQRQFWEFLSNNNAFCRVRCDYFTATTFYETLLLHIQHFCRAVNHLGN